MEPTQFWKIIESSKAAADQGEQLERLKEILNGLSLDEICSFDRILHELLAQSYSFRLWGAAYLINGGCSDDGFDYFRAWLIAQGQSVFEAALAEPDSLADYEPAAAEVEFEELCYAASCVYETKTDDEIPDSVFDGIENSELGEDWDFDDNSEMKSRYPKLFQKFAA